MSIHIIMSFSFFSSLIAIEDFADALCICQVERYRPFIQKEQNLYKRNKIIYHLTMTIIAENLVKLDDEKPKNMKKSLI